jgi:hypothetical protein
MVNPYELCNVADLGDASVNPIDLLDTLKRVEDFFAEIHAAGTIPLTAGGDHLITLPIFRAIAKSGPIGMVHYDAHRGAGYSTPPAQAPACATKRASKLDGPLALVKSLALVNRLEIAVLIVRVSLSAREQQLIPLIGIPVQTHRPCQLRSRPVRQVQTAIAR